MLIASCTFAILAGLLHVLIFMLESLRWTEPKTMEIIIRSVREAESTQKKWLITGHLQSVPRHHGPIGRVNCAERTICRRFDGDVCRHLVDGARCRGVLFAGSPDKRHAAVKRSVSPAIELVLLVSIIV
nr:hypothetical protein [Bifidobacterium biavatii]